MPSYTFQVHLNEALNWVRAYGYRDSHPRQTSRQSADGVKPSSQEDIPALADFFLSSASQKFGRNITHFSDEALKIMKTQGIESVRTGRKCYFKDENGILSEDNLKLVSDKLLFNKVIERAEIDIR